MSTGRTTRSSTTSPSTTLHPWPRSAWPCTRPTSTQWTTRSARPSTSTTLLSSSTSATLRWRAATDTQTDGQTACCRWMSLTVMSVLLQSMDHFDDIGPSVVMASPGMMQSGLSRELFESWCTDKRNGVIIAGYCVEGTLAKVRQDDRQCVKG